MPKIECDNCDNHECFIKKYALKEWLPVIGYHKPVYHFKKNELIIKEGDYTKGIYFIYSGKVKITKTWDKDNEYIVRLAKSGDIIGHRGIGSMHQYTISATALSDTTVCFLESAWFYKILKANPELLFNIMLFFADELQKAELRMRNLIHLPAKGRVADTLLMLYRVFGNDEHGFLNVNLSRKDIAAHAGTTYETIIRNLAALHNEKYIALSGKKIKILNQKGLEDLCTQLLLDN